MQEIQKSLLIAINSQGELLIQDRAGHKTPPFGFFGGGVETGESHAQAVIRETKEELNLDITEQDIVYMGDISSEWLGSMVVRHLYLYKTDQKDFTVLEGAGAEWLSPEEAQVKLDIHERFNVLMEMVKRTIQLR